MRRIVRTSSAPSNPLPALGGLADGVSRLSDDDREDLADELALLTGATSPTTVSRAAVDTLFDDEPTSLRPGDDEDDEGGWFDEAMFEPAFTEPSTRQPGATPTRAPSPVAPAPAADVIFFVAPGEAPPADLWRHAVAVDEGPRTPPAAPPSAPASEADPEELDEAGMKALLDEVQAEIEAEMADAAEAWEDEQETYALIAEDLDSDADDWARSEEDGWFYGDDS